LCQRCGGTDLLAEPELDQEEPTGGLLVTCGSCGRQIGELSPAAQSTSRVESEA
jgi:hypothetical protein